MHDSEMDFTRSNIDHLRGRRSIKQVGEESKVSQSWLQRYMKPDNASGIQKANAVKVGQLATYFGVSVDDLTKRDLSHASSQSQSHSQSARLDVDRLAGLIEAVEQAADDEGLNLPPRMRARFVAALFLKHSGEPLTGDAMRAALSALMSSLEE